ncbi:MAG: hypothetical protein GX025_08110, partial [Clostridiales bacterium]|nr:hypothetical protein [Clostridiales bacterium]
MGYPLITAYPMARIVRVGLISLSHNPVLADWKHSAAFFISKNKVFSSTAFINLRICYLLPLGFPLGLAEGFPLVKDLTDCCTLALLPPPMPLALPETRTWEEAFPPLFDGALAG